ncbi:MAG: hypothetical protein QOI29_2824 [Mycobacterium sp.]|jgi:glycosyltransferase involved in cell wall biosynthesis|nr:hypothetical protein [Mycobacterium sp.]
MTGLSLKNGAHGYGSSSAPSQLTGPTIEDEVGNPSLVVGGSSSPMGSSSGLEIELGSVLPRRPTVSVCIPAFQAERHLQATIDSVLAQNYADLDIVIVDNNSSDGTRDILEMVKDDRVRIIRNATTLPMHANFNFAVHQSRGEFVKVVCADDTIEPECIEAQVAVLEHIPEVVLVAARTDFIDDAGELLRPAKGLGGIVGRQPAQRVIKHVIRSGTNPIGPPVAVMFRRINFDRCGGFRTDLSFVGDLDLWVRLLHGGDFFGQPLTLASFRINSESVTGWTSARSQLVQKTEFDRRLVGDPRWNISAADRAQGRLKRYDMQMRRTLLYALSNRRGLRRSRQSIASTAGEKGQGNSQALRRSSERSDDALLAPNRPEVRDRGDFGSTEILDTERGAPGAIGEGCPEPAENLSVVICTYTILRWAALCRAAESVLAQDRGAMELIVVIDHCHELYLRACNRFRGDRRVTVLENTQEPGLSGARNTGVGAAHGDVIAFIDDDAVAEPGWARALMHHYQDGRVVGVGGYAVPVWPEGRPAWMPWEFDWVVGCSYAGQPTELAPVRNPLGCNMSLRRSVFDVVGGFRSEVGRIGSIPVGGEETEICIRIGASQPSSQILFDPEARVQHHISPDRATLRYFIRRCHHEGMSKAIVTELTNAPKALGTERAYALNILPRAMLREGLSMSRDGLVRAAVMLLGLVVTTAGYVNGKANRRLLLGAT